MYLASFLLPNPTSGLIRTMKCFLLPLLVCIQVGVPASTAQSHRIPRSEDGEKTKDEHYSWKDPVLDVGKYPKGPKDPETRVLEVLQPASPLLAPEGVVPPFPVRGHPRPPHSAPCQKVLIRHNMVMSFGNPLISTSPDHTFNIVPNLVLISMLTF